MEYCTICGTHSDLCNDDSHEHVEACYCRNCDSISCQEDLDHNDLCEDCVSAFDDYVSEEE